tara:strand:- start:273 stop:419 length:147 start_codon:yes stop_codon:yes gene_type:complete
MKINAIRAFIIAALAIVLLYALGLFLPIIIKSKPQVNHIDNLKIDRNV